MRSWSWVFSIAKQRVSQMITANLPPASRQMKRGAIPNPVGRNSLGKFPTPVEMPHDIALESDENRRVAELGSVGLSVNFIAVETSWNLRDARCQWLSS